MDKSSINELMSFIEYQKEITDTDLPHRHHLLIEHFDDPLNTSDSKQVILHTLWGGRINRPFSMALSEAWEETYKYPLEVFADDDCILLMLPHRFRIEDMFRLVSSENIEQLLRNRLEKTGFFGARFRENAGRALLLPRIGFKKRMPLWMNRLRSKKLMEAVMGAENFPILLETWRTCLKDEFDLENLKMLLDEIENGSIRVSETITRTVSPFSKGLVFRQTDKHMYEDDTPHHGSISGLTHDLIREINSNAGLFPEISNDLIRVLERKLQRTQEGYSPSSSEDLVDWAKERLLIPEDEFRFLLARMEMDHGVKMDAILKSTKQKLVKIGFKNTEVMLICAIEILPRITRDFEVALQDISVKAVLGKMTSKITENIHKAFEVFSCGRNEDSEIQLTRIDFVSRYLSFYGPVEEAFLCQILGLPDTNVSEIIQALEKNDQVVGAVFRENTKISEICDRENLEILLRMARKERVPEFSPHPVDVLPLYLASHQGICVRGVSIEDLQDRLDLLFGYSAPASAWESFILPARLEAYYPSWLDSLMQTSELLWFGTGSQSISFAFSEDLELFFEPKSNDNMEKEVVEDILPHKHGRYGFFDIAAHTGLSTDEASKKIWHLVWKGQLVNDTFDVLRKGIQNKFKPLKTTIPKGKMKSRRGHFNRWKSSRPVNGNFYSPFLETPEDLNPLEEEENRKERVRQLLRRYGIIFRELLIKEGALLKWSQIFRTLRLMELSGEILSGIFFRDVTGPQFISPEGLRALKNDMAEDTIFWMNATDPSSLCGILPDSCDPPLPPRRATNYIVFHGRKQVMAVKKNGKEVDIYAPLDSLHFSEYFILFKDLLNRRFDPFRSIRIETINGEKILKSPYTKHFLEFGFSKDYKGLVLRKKI